MISSNNVELHSEQTTTDNNRQQPFASLPEQRPSIKKDGKRELLSTLAVIVLAPVVALFLTVFVFQSYEVDGPSMENTLQDNDRLIVSKTDKTWSKFSGKQFLPDRYSVVVFKQKESSYEGTEEKQLIKRVMGLPGDRVVIKDGVVTIYNDEHPEGLKADENVPETSLNQYTDGDIDLTVPEGQVFVLGDNRKNSLDSRAFGTIDADSIVGNLSARIYPLNQIKKF